MGPLRATRGSTGFSADEEGTGGDGPNNDTGGEGVGKRGGEGVWDGLELTVFRIRESNSKSGREEAEEDGAGGSEEGGGFRGGGCE